MPFRRDSGNVIVAPSAVLIRRASAGDRNTTCNVAPRCPARSSRRRAERGRAARGIDRHVAGQNQQLRACVGASSPMATRRRKPECPVGASPGSAVNVCSTASVVAACRLAKTQSLRKANAARHVLERVELAQIIAVAGGQDALVAFAAVPIRYRVAARRFSERQQLRHAGFPVPALAARLLAGRVADPPGGQPIAGQIEQHVVAVGQSDHQRRTNCRPPMSTRSVTPRPVRSDPACSPAARRAGRWGWAA